MKAIVTDQDAVEAMNRSMGLRSSATTLRERLIRDDTMSPGIRDEARLRIADLLSESGAIDERVRAYMSSRPV
jgi:hypothetical protein